jgi:hypothetical protein
MRNGIICNCTPNILITKQAPLPRASKRGGFEPRLAFPRDGIKMQLFGGRRQDFNHPRRHSFPSTHSGFGWLWVPANDVEPFVLASSMAASTRVVAACASTWWSALSSKRHKTGNEF